MRLCESERQRKRQRDRERIHGKIERKRVWRGGVRDRALARERRTPGRKEEMDRKYEELYGKAKWSYVRAASTHHTGS
jgi:hypothetical protein